jgi:hypothetical protein
MKASRLALCAILLLSPHAAQPDSPPRPYPDRQIDLPAQEIDEIFLRYLAGVIRADVPADLRRQDLFDLFPEFREIESATFHLLARVARLAAAVDGHARLLFSFDHDLLVGVPFVFPWYKPVTIQASQTVVLAETRRDSRALERGSGASTILSPLYEYRMERGGASVHFQAWMIALSAGLLDTFSIRGAALFGYRGSWHALLCGRNPRDRLVCWLYDLRRMRPVIPVPREFIAYAAELAGP